MKQKGKLEKGIYIDDDLTRKEREVQQQIRRMGRVRRDEGGYVRIGYVAALDSKLPNGFCPEPRYTRTLPFEQMIARCRYTLSEYLQRA